MASPFPYCAAHRKQVKGQQHKAVDMHRGSSTQRGYDAQWQKMRKVVMAQDPYCRSCKNRGIVRAATDIDHIIPHKGNDELRLSAKNLQPLCKQCHGEKSQRESRQ